MFTSTWDRLHARSVPRLSLATLLLAVLPCVAQADRVRVRTFGRVTKADGKDWPSAQVVLHARGRLGIAELGIADVIEVECDQRGRFRAELLPGRTYDVFAHGGEESPRVTRIAHHIGAGQSVRLFEDDRRSVSPRLEVSGLEVWSAMHGRVRVLDATGLRHDVVTGDEGDIALPNLPGTEMRVELYARERRVATWTRSLIGEARPIHVPPPLRVPIHVVDKKSGSAVSGARITFGDHDRLVAPRPAFEPWPGTFGVATPSATTDAGGRAVLTVAGQSGEADRPLDFMIEAAGYARTLAGWNDATRGWAKLGKRDGESTETLEVALDRGFGLRGRVAGPGAGGRVVVAEVWFTEVGGASIARFFRTTRTDGDGRYNLPGLAKDWTRVFVSLVLGDGNPDRPPLSPLVSIYRGDLRSPSSDVVTSLDLASVREIELRFALPDGAPATGAEVVLTHPRERDHPDHPLYHGIRCDRRGRCRARTADKKLFVTAYASRHHVEAQLDTSRLPKAVELVASARFAGRVLDARGEPVAGAEIMTAGARHFPGSSAFLTARAARNETSLRGVTDHQGRFELFFVPGRSEYSLLASRSDARGNVLRSRPTPFYKATEAALELALPRR